MAAVEVVGAVGVAADWEATWEVVAGLVSACKAAMGILATGGPDSNSSATDGLAVRRHELAQVLEPRTCLGTRNNMETSCQMETLLVFLICSSLDA